MMTTDIELADNEAIPLPWYPPYCLAYKGPKSKHDKLKSVKEWPHIKVRTPEREIEANYVLHSPEKDFHEWGARVNMAMKKVS